MKTYRTTLAVHEALESLSKVGTCQQCKRNDVRVYPYLAALFLCAGCIVAAGQHG